jgi:PAS domain S-box-containing protein
MRRWARLAVPLSAVLPVPVAAVAVAAHLQPSGVALLLLLSVLAACLLGGTGAGIAAAAVSLFVFDLNVLAPRGAWTFGAVAVADLAILALADAAAVLGVHWLRRAGRRAQAARADAERHSSALAAQVALVAPVLDESPVGFAVFDPQLRYRYINRALAAIHGVAAGEHVGRRFSDIYPDEADLLEPYVNEVLSTGQPQLEQLVSTPAGRHFRVDRYPIRDGTGVITGVALTVQDVTERRRLIDVRAEADRLRATVELVFKLEAAQRIAGLGSWDADLATGTTRWSRQLQQMLGAPGPGEPADQPDDPLAEAVHPDDVADAKEKVRALLEEGRPFRAEYRIRRRDGTLFEAICTGEAVPGPDGRPVGVWGTILDVSDQRRAEREAREAIRQAEQARAQMEVEHQALQLVQAAMLPAGVPAVPGLDLAVAYLPVEAAADVGGDWYDAFTLPDGRLAIAVGDVTGHDLRAATIMGQVRNAVRAYALLNAVPGWVAGRANALLCSLPDLDLATMLFGVYDPATHTLTWSRAGHPPPLLYRDGDVVELDEPSGRLLGAAPDGPYVERTRRLDVGETLLWYTDGLLEHPDHDSARYIDLLQERASALGGGVSAERLVADLTEVLIPRIVQADDICLLAISRSSEPAPPP